MEQVPLPAVSTGNMLRLGDFSSVEIDPMDLKQASLYISQILHNPITLGYPDPTNAFSDLGFSIQAIGHTTASFTCYKSPTCFAITFEIHLDL